MDEIRKTLEVIYGISLIDIEGNGNSQRTTIESAMIEI